MSNIEELQARITAALDRVQAGVDNLPAGDAGEADALRAQLEEERTVSAQHEERLRVLKEKQIQELEAVTAGAQDTRAKAEALDLELQRLRETSAALRASNAALRDANAAGLADAELINSGLTAELEALRAERAADIAETSAILAALAPVLKGSDDSKEAENA